MEQPAKSTFDYDVALSFAGEDRMFVQKIAMRLEERNIRIFYDEYAAAELWGNDLYVLLDQVYRERARFVVAFISRHYVSKPWTQHERQSAQARALTEVGPYFLPVRLDDSELPGLRPTVAYVDARDVSTDQLIAMIEQKLSIAPGVTTHDVPVLRSPRNAQQTRELLAQRPTGWEYLLYAGVLWQRRQELEPKWRDHELGYARRTRVYLDNGQAISFMRNSFRDLESFGPSILRMLNSQTQERAFGVPGSPGDPSLIEHIASRLVVVYEEMLDTAAALRGAGASSTMARVLEATARLADRPLREIRDFIDQVVARADSIPDRLASSDGAGITISLTLTIDEEALLHHGREIVRAERELGI